MCPSGCTHTTIALALAAAQNGDTIQLPQPSYLENNLKVTKSLSIVGTSASKAAVGVVTGNSPIFVISGTLTVNISNIIIQNGFAFGPNQGAGISTSAGAPRLTLDNVIVRNNTISNGTAQAYGGGIAAGGPLTITNSIISGNSALGFNNGGAGYSATGGGIGAYGQSIYISNTQIISNVAIGGATAYDYGVDAGFGGGGGIYYTNSNGGTVFIANSVITGNVAIGGDTGGRQFTTAGSANGGGIVISDFGGFSPVRVSIDRVTIANNSARGGGTGGFAVPGEGATFGGDANGGGLWTGFNTAITLTNSTVFSNSVTGGQAMDPANQTYNGGKGGSVQGGGLNLGGVSFITSTAIVSNVASGGKPSDGAAESGANTDGGVGGNGGTALGGGIYAASGITVTNSTIALNKVIGANGANGGDASGSGSKAGNGGAGGDGKGAGLYTVGSGAIANIRSSTIASNTAASGIGGSAGNVTLSATGGNAGSVGTADGGGLYNVSSNVDLVANIFAKNVGGSLSNSDITPGFTSHGGNVFSTTPGGVLVNDKTGTDPLLGKVQDNGGNTLTSALGVNSPAIGFAGNRTCPDLDQRGQPRRTGYCDSGAFAVQPTSLQQISGSGQSTIVQTNFGAPLVVKPFYGTAVITGASVTYNRPDSGASLDFGGPVFTVVTATNGLAQLSATANAVVGGPYLVIASAGTATPTNFSLTNLARPTTTTVSSSPNPSGPGLGVDVTAVVSAVGGTPSGNVTITADTGETCQLAAPSSSCSLIFTTTGTRTLTASYPGDSQHLPSSGTSSHTVAVGGGGNPGTPGTPSGGNQVVYIGAAYINAPTTF